MTPQPVLDAGVLGRVLVLQSSLQAAPDEQRLMEMVAHGLTGLPGVEASASCVEGVVSRGDGRPMAPCPEAARRPKPLPRSCHECLFTAADGWQAFGLATPRAEYGAVFLQVRDADVLGPYLAFVSNTVNLVALRIENGRNADDLAALNRRLDEEIRERTRQLRESEAILARSQEIAHVGSWVLDPADGSLRWSDEVYRMLGCRPQEFPADYQTFLDMMPPDDRVKVDLAYRGSVDEGRDSYEIEHRVVRRDTGETRILHEKCVNVRDGAGRIVRSEGMVQDITERKRAEEERVALERQMQHAQKMESLGVLAGGIAHDFNNLLMAILGNADLALDIVPPASPVRDNLMEIKGAARRAAEFARQMLAYSGKGRFLIEPIDAGALVREMAHLLEVVIAKGVVLKYNFAANLPSFNGDATQVRQVIMNLITNASESIGDRSGVVALSTGGAYCERKELDAASAFFRTPADVPLPEGLYVFIEVADTGCGMDAETVERVFDPFFTTKFTGRGLGMSAVLGIVRGHRGAIRIRSEVGKGTSFRVMFPAAAGKVESETGPAGTAPRAEDWRGTGTVLLVDDEESVRAVGRRMLERLGFTVLAAADGREAVELTSRHGTEIVAVVLDLTMPHMDGEQTFAELRKTGSNVPVILCSGYTGHDALQRAHAIGLAGFIQKPYDVATLRAALRAALEAAS